MLRFVIEKIKNKKWLNLCLLAGLTLLVAVFSCHPMFANGSDNQLLATAFADYAKENNEFPAIFSRSGGFSSEKSTSTEDVYGWMDRYEEKWLQYVDVDVIVSQQHIKSASSLTTSNLGVANRLLNVGVLKDMEAHIEIVDGEGFSGSAKTAEGMYPCMITRQTVEETGLVVGEELSFAIFKDENKTEARFVVTGVFEAKESRDNYWCHPLDDYGKELFVSRETMDDLLAVYKPESMIYTDDLLLDYTQIVSSNATEYQGYIQQFQEADRLFSCNFTTILQDYQEKSGTAHRILWVLELPCVVLLLLFIYMISGQISSAEEGEIAVLRSRGVTRAQTIWLYILQSLLLSLAGLLAGIVLGYFMCKGAASTEAFLQFENKDVRLYTFVISMLPFGLLACVIALVFMTAPVWKKAKVTIVALKSSAAKKSGAPFWEKYFLDILLLLVSCYLLYNYNKQSRIISESVLAGEGLDPMVFLDASLFIFSCGLVLLRLTRYLLLLVDRIGKKRWKAVNFAGFLQINRSFHRQSFILVFMVMTIAIGVFNASMARTVNANNEERIRYEAGCDLRMQEKWRLWKTLTPEKEFVWSYDEPDFQRYEELVKKGLCSSVTRVLNDNNTSMTAGGKTMEQCRLMGIHTREFGETADLMEGLGDSHWYNGLNALAQQSNGILISRNMATELDIKEGAEVIYSRFSPLDESKVEGMEKAVVVGIVDCFPGYESVRYVYNEEGELTEQPNYLIVANYAQVVNTFKQTPYAVWMRLAPGHSSQEVMDAAQGMNIPVESWLSRDEEVEKSRSSALFQITNGMFTMSFVISILICAVGFLIYWMMSMKKRQQMFGIYRAMGMRMSEIRRMLLLEQMFGSILPIAVGGGVGALSTLLFVKLVALVYLPQKHNIPLQTYIYGGDMVRLFAVIFAIVILCLLVLRRQLKNMKIAQALRLGED